VLAEGRYAGWIRPVSSRPKAEVLPAECRYADGTIPKLLDIIDVPLSHPAPAYPQSENHVFDPSDRWLKRGELPWGALSRLCDHPTSLWLNTDHTQQGTNDCPSGQEASSFRKSLFLIRQMSFTVEVGHRTWDGVPSRTYRGHFNYYGTYYKLSVTDRAVRDMLARKKEGPYPLNDVYLCISLTEPYDEDGRCHKLVAAVIKNPST
jgi:hypothetical protein